MCTTDVELPIIHKFSLEKSERGRDRGKGKVQRGVWVEVEVQGTKVVGTGRAVKGHRGIEVRHAESLSFTNDERARLACVRPLVLMRRLFSPIPTIGDRVSSEGKLMFGLRTVCRDALGERVHL